MHKTLLAALLLAAAAFSLCLVACVPMKIIDDPGLTGTVIDLQTNKPISGAKVCELHEDPKTIKIDRCAVSDSQGTFAIETIQHRQWIFIMVEFFPQPGMFLVSANGYKDQEIKAGYWQKMTIALRPDGQE